MDTKEIKKYLMGYAGLKMKVQNQTERIIRARNNTLIPAIRQSDGSQRQPGGVDRLGNVVTKALDLEERLLPQIEENSAKMRSIEEAVESLDDYYESEVLCLRYLNCYYIDEHGEEHSCQLVPWKYVSLKLYGDDDEKHLQATYRLHGRALQSIGRVIFPNVVELGTWVPSYTWMEWPGSGAAIKVRDGWECSCCHHVEHDPLPGECPRCGANMSKEEKRETDEMDL